ncbi:hypothetical protein RWV98_18800 [Agathobaculum sp. NTUH-O15-33]|uniref:plasmid mobilization protein n=1 Tax=Agathobaculum sp. NTUH-O15-33 TaxID=3079302 RepID=UPI0029583D03|nr:hypothetical protein [Agathobaculum sp. NTUH-O15-33]WNX84599.1 hypothetical protein RWV98_18800 [Agathobaculum sp. NTUH-O15-33]
MSKRKEESKPYTVFCLLHPHKQEFYIGKTLTQFMNNAYTDHMTLTKYRATKSMFEEAKETKELPLMYSLTTREMTRTEAEKHQIIWTQYFELQGYYALDRYCRTKAQKPFTNQMEEIFQSIQKKTLSEICNDRTRLLADYGTRRKKTKPLNASTRTQINIRVTPEEYQLIGENAKQCTLSMSEYCKQIAIQKLIININYKAISDYGEEVARLGKVLDHMAFAIIKSGDCFEGDFHTIRNSLAIINEGQAQMIEKLDEERKNIYRILRKQRRYRTVSRKKSTENAITETLPERTAKADENDLQ